MLDFTGLGNIRQAAQILILPNGTNQSNHIRGLCAGGVLGASGAIALPCALCLGEYAGAKKRHGDGTEAKECAN